VWAPFAKSVKVMGDFTSWNAAPVSLASENNGNWSADVPNVKPFQMYKCVIENVGGPGNDNSQIWQRADARAVQVENSGAAAATYVVPPINQSTRPSFTSPAFENFILYQLHIGSFAGLNDVRSSPARNRTATFVDLVDKLGYTVVLASMALRCCRSVRRSAMSVKATARLICSRRKMHMQPAKSLRLASCLV
jgi:1,4-alpha-glucan branching enzyme